MAFRNTSLSINHADSKSEWLGACSFGRQTVNCLNMISGAWFLRPVLCSWLQEVFCFVGCFFPRDQNNVSVLVNMVRHAAYQGYKLNINDSYEHQNKWKSQLRAAHSLVEDCIYP